MQPRLALVHDNSLAGYTGPFAGRRSRFEVSQTIGGWRFFQGLADYRRYDKIAGPIVLATRGLFLGRFGRDANQFQNFIGVTDFIRGHTSGSYDRNECAVMQATPANSQTRLRRAGPPDRLALRRGLGRAAVPHSHAADLPQAAERGAADRRGVLLRRRYRLERRQHAQVEPQPAIDDLENTRTPLQAYGASVRTNLFGFVILRLDYARPLNRPITSLWTLSLGPTF